MKRRVPVEGRREAGLRGGDWGVERSWRVATFEHLEKNTKKTQIKTEKRGLYRMLFIMRCDREMELGAKWATFTSSRKWKKDCEAGVVIEQEILQ